MLLSAMLQVFLQNLRTLTAHVAARLVGLGWVVFDPAEFSYFRFLNMVPRAFFVHFFFIVGFAPKTVIV